MRGGSELIKVSGSGTAGAATVPLAPRHIGRGKSTVFRCPTRSATRTRRTWFTRIARFSERLNLHPPDFAALIRATSAAASAILPQRIISTSLLARGERRWPTGKPLRGGALSWAFAPLRIVIRGRAPDRRGRRIESLSVTIALFAWMSAANARALPVVHTGLLNAFLYYTIAVVIIGPLKGEFLGCHPPHAGLTAPSPTGQSRRPAWGSPCRRRRSRHRPTASGRCQQPANRLWRKRPVIHTVNTTPAFGVPWVAVPHHPTHFARGHLGTSTRAVAPAIALSFAVPDSASSGGANHRGQRVAGHHHG